jgi:hypothetical protein
VQVPLFFFVPSQEAIHPMSDEQAQLQLFLDRVRVRPLPQNPLAKLRMLARELAEGALEGLWDTVVFRLFRDQKIPVSESITAYLEQRWGDKLPGVHLLFAYGYLEQPTDTPNMGLLTKAAFDLVEEVERESIFISYRRKESSAFALLVLARLKMAGLNAFVDLALEAGEDWERGLKDRIQKYHMLIALLGPETLRSEVVRQEITWALEAKLAIIPVWHNGFIYRADDWPELTLKVHQALEKTHTIRVVEESALGYNNALVELLNRFGVTP